jgi:hypothetical protein
MDCWQAGRGKVIDLITRPLFDLATFSALAARKNCLEIKKCRDLGISIAERRVSLSEAAWSSRNFVRCCLQPAAKAHVSRSIETAFPMTTLTDRELEALIGLRTSWEMLYSKELARLLDEDNTIRAIDRLRKPSDEAAPSGA